MSDLAQVTEQIRFSIEQLSVANGHHEFEHLCRNFARLRISQYVIPATGPVSAGGDQGRDFETFRSFLGEKLNSENSRWLFAPGAAKRIAFGCTLQKGNLKSKIKGDLQTIAESRPPVDSVYYFLGCDLPVAHRHELQAWATDTVEIDLEIIDANALSEQLSCEDLFWIASRYLRIPLEIYPRIDNPEDEYFAALKKWKAASEFESTNYADFTEVRGLARFALDEKSYDISFWLSVLDRLTEPDQPDFIRRPSLYEFLAISMRQTRSWNGIEDRVEEFLENLQEITYPDDVEDALVILSYTVTNHLIGAREFEKSKILQWCETIQGIVVNGLESSETSTRRCSWLKLSGSIEFQLGALLRGSIDCARALNQWLLFADEVSFCPIFPLSSFSDSLTLLVPLIGDYPQFEKLCEKVDTILAERTGKSHAADKCRDRAIAYHESGNLFKAIEQIHKSKIGWFTEEALEGTAVACHTLSGFYQSLGLNFAAKYYGLVESFICLNTTNDSLRDRIPRALQQIASCDFCQGSWFSFWRFNKAMVIAHSAMSPDPGDLSIHKFFGRQLIPIYHTLAITERIFPSACALSSELHEDCALGQDFDQLYVAASETWEKVEPLEIRGSLAKQIDGLPWSDVGQSVVSRWSAFGISWLFKWDNKWLSTVAAEEFLALFQVSLVELVQFDTCMMGGVVTVEMHVGGAENYSLKRIPSNEKTIWSLTIPDSDEGVEAWHQIRFPTLIGIAAEMLRNQSLLPEEKFRETISKHWLPRVSQNSFFGQTYRRCYETWIPEVEFEEDRRRNVEVELGNWPEGGREDVKTLTSKCSITDSIKIAELEETIRNRYAKTESVKWTLTRLLADPNFLATLSALREKGWKDWHVFLAVFNTVANYRGQKLFQSRPHSDEVTRFYKKLMESAETEEDEPVPQSEFTAEKLDFMLKMSMLGTLGNHGLELHQQTPDMTAVENFLAERLRYWELDVPHQPTLP